MGGLSAGDEWSDSFLGNEFEGGLIEILKKTPIELLKLLGGVCPAHRIVAAGIFIPAKFDHKFKRTKPEPCRIDGHGNRLSWTRRWGLILLMHLWISQPALDLLKGRPKKIGRDDAFSTLARTCSSSKYSPREKIASKNQNKVAKPNDPSINMT